MLLIVGLGNPGPKYAGHRHNVGFMAVDAIVRLYGLGPWRAKFQAEAAEGAIESDKGPVKALALKPQTFMNESGRAVAAAAQFHKIPPEKVIVFYDELDLAPGKFRSKRGGGAAGHNGIRSIIAQYGPDFWRGRIGIGHPGQKEQVLGHVLSDFHKADRAWIEPLCDAIARALPLFAAGDTDAFQTRVTYLAPAPEPVERGGEG